MLLHFKIHCISAAVSRRTCIGICVVYGLKWRGSLVITVTAVIYIQDVLFGNMLYLMCNNVMSLAPNMFKHMVKLRGSGGVKLKMMSRAELFFSRNIRSLV
jgi:hypothetical protein